MSDSPIDRLSSLLERFRVRAQLSHSGTMCGLQRFDRRAGKSYLHVLREGRVEVSHPGSKGTYARLTVNEPTLLFYPRPVTHEFHNPPRDGSQFTCAEVEFEGGLQHPLVQALPQILVLPLREVDGLDASLALLFNETTRIRCGQRVLANRLFEVVLIQLLRWLLDHPERAAVNVGLLAGLASRPLARALTAIHEAPGTQWSLETLAEVSGMSRTAFTTKFKATVGKTPADYLADWRLSIAKTRICEGVPLKLLAIELGYANQSALSRVFRQRVGLSPREWLAQQ